MPVEPTFDGRADDGPDVVKTTTSALSRTTSVGRFINRLNAAILLCIGAAVALLAMAWR